MSAYLSTFLNRARAVMQRFEKTQLCLIEDRDLIAWLKELGIFDSIVQGELTCAQCSGHLNLDNLAGVILDGDKYRPFCDSHGLGQGSSK